MTAGAPVHALRVAPLDNGRHQVVDPNGSGEPHIVDATERPPTCDCPDHRFRRPRCKHIVAVEQFLLAAPIDLAPIGPELEPDVPLPDAQGEDQPVALVAGSNGRPMHAELRAIGDELAALQAARAMLPPVTARARLEVLRSWLWNVRLELPDPFGPAGGRRRWWQHAAGTAS